MDCIIILVRRQGVSQHVYLRLPVGGWGQPPAGIGQAPSSLVGRNKEKKKKKKLSGRELQGRTGPSMQGTE